MNHTDPASIVQIMPAGGWRVTLYLDDGTTWNQPLVGWGLTPSGDVVPLDTDETGHVENLHDCGNRYRVHHPSKSASNPHAAAKALFAEHAADTGETP